MDAYYGEVRAFAFGFCPDNWLPCDGRQLLINQYQALMAVIGYNFTPHPDGIHFNLPNLQGCVVVNAVPSPSSDYYIGLGGGTETVTLHQSNISTHNHNVQVFDRTTVAQGSLMVNTPANNVYLTGADSITNTPAKTIYAYSANKSDAILNIASLGPVGSANPTPHENRMPFVTMYYCICVYDAVFPVRPD